MWRITQMGRPVGQRLPYLLVKFWNIFQAWTSFSSVTVASVSLVHSPSQSISVLYRMAWVWFFSEMLGFSFNTSTSWLPFPLSSLPARNYMIIKGSLLFSAYSPHESFKIRHLWLFCCRAVLKVVDVVDKRRQIALWIKSERRESAVWMSTTRNVSLHCCFPSDL